MVLADRCDPQPGHETLPQGLLDQHGCVFGPVDGHLGGKPMPALRRGDSSGQRGIPVWLMPRHERGDLPLHRLAIGGVGTRQALLQVYQRASGIAPLEQPVGVDLPRGQIVGMIPQHLFDGGNFHRSNIALTVGNALPRHPSDVDIAIRPPGAPPRQRFCRSG